MSRCPTVSWILALPNLGAEFTERHLVAMPKSGLELETGLSRRQGLDMPNSEQGVAVKADERVVPEGSIN
jgi:hypothetical protein